MSFDNCTQAYQAGRSHIPETDPAYGKHLDRDNDGIGCDNPPPGFKTQPAVQPGTETGTGTGEQLPVTGPAAEVGVFGAGMLVLGITAALFARRRRKARHAA
jgi:LPXTG-motif cell wall-anchored protein